MALRRLGWMLPLAAALVAVSSVPNAGAVGPFDPALRVIQDCGVGLGDASISGDGTVRGFAECNGDPYGPIWFFNHRTGAPGAAPSDYTGTVLATAWDGVDTLFVLFEQDNTLKLGKLVEGVGYAPAQTLSSSGADFNFYSGDLVASHGQWWAVWSEQVGAGENAHFQLFEAHTLGSTKARTRLSNTAANVSDDEPTLTLTSGVPVLAWSRTTVTSTGRLSSDIRIGNNRGGVWSTRLFAAVGTENYSPNVFGYAGTVYVTWVHDGRIMEADNPSGVWRTKAFYTPGQFPYIGASMGKTWVTWAAGETDSDSRVFLAERAGSTWSGSYLTVGNAAPLAVLGQGGKARVLFRTPNNVYLKDQH